MSKNEKVHLPKVKSSLWSHPLVFIASAVGLVGSGVVLYTHKRAQERARSLSFKCLFFFVFYFLFLALFLEKPFYEEALELTRGYKPIVEKLVEPIQPLRIDTTSKFNILSHLGAQVSLLMIFFFFIFIIK